MLKNIISVLAGLVAGVPVTALIGASGQAVNPSHNYIELDAPGATEAYISSLPISAFIFEIAAWVLGAFVACGLTARLSLKSVPTYITAGILLGLCAVKLVLLPQPIWMTPACIVLIPLAGVIAMGVFGRGRA